MGESVENQATRANGGAKEVPRDTRRSWTGREKTFLGTTIVFLIAAIAGFALYATALVPATAAAKVDDFYIDEQAVAQMISEQRARYDLESDSEFASYLLTQGMNVYTYRQSVINQIALNTLINNKASELGVMPSDDEVDKQVQAMRDMNDANDDESWQKVLDQQGVSEEGLRAQLKTNLAEQAIYEKLIDHPEATDSDTRAYVKENRAEGIEKHSWRATFSGDDAKSRAEAFRQQVLSLGANLNADSFSILAASYSDSPTIAEDGGDAGWTYMDGSTSYAKALADMKVGDVSEVVETENEGNYGVAYCDEVYEYPDSDSTDSMDLTELDDDLLDELKSLAADDLYKDKCNEYLASLLTDIDITYYPIPKGAVYDIDMQLASMAAGTYLDEMG